MNYFFLCVFFFCFENVYCNLAQFDAAFHSFISDTQHMASTDLKPQVVWCDACRVRPATSVCGACRTQVYCSEQCQRSDWVKHADSCCAGFSASPLAAAAAAAIDRVKPQLQAFKLSVIFNLAGQFVRLALWLRNKAEAVLVKIEKAPKNTGKSTIALVEARKQWISMAHQLGVDSRKLFMNKRSQQRSYRVMASSAAKTLQLYNEAKREDVLGDAAELYGAELVGERMSKLEMDVKRGVVASIKTDSDIPDDAYASVIKYALGEVLQPEHIRLAIAIAAQNLPAVMEFPGRQLTLVTKQEFLDFLLRFFSGVAGISLGKAAKMRAVKGQLDTDAFLDVDSELMEDVFE